MIPGTPQELDILAGEYVLGVLEPDAAREVEAALPDHEELRHAVAFWQERLHPLAALAAPAEPPPKAWQRIESRLDAPAATKPSPWRSLALWRSAAMIAAAIAACLALYIALAPPAGPLYVAVLRAPQQQAPSFVATGGRNHLRLRSVAQEQPPHDRSFELWEVLPGAKPQSLGVLPADGRLERSTLPQPLADGTTLAISIEPKAGSPTGQPTGPVVFVGTVLAAR
jgi:anti-sigma-K factor RskA